MKYKIKEATPRWKDLPEIRRGYEYTEYMEKEHGYSYIHLKGGIGTYGQKTHLFYVLGKIDEDTLYIADYDPCCGSAKWGSSLNLYSMQDETIQVTCKICQKTEIAIAKRKGERGTP